MKAYIVVDLGFGDAGKGTVIDYLSCLTPNTLIVRYNGGPQAAHNVVTAKGVHHTFAQFGSGTLVPTVKTYLSEYMWIDPLSMLRENEGLCNIDVTDALSRLSINVETPIVTPFHKVANRVLETKNRHGSCGMGMGNAVADSLDGLVLRVRDLLDHETAMKKLKTIQEKKRAEVGVADAILDDPKAPELCMGIYEFLLAQNVKIVENLDTHGFDQVIFEGAGGVLLDENYGFHPHTMWTTTTTKNAWKLWYREATEIGVIRTYSTRHGNGPFVTETDLPFVDKYNITNEWQGGFRTGVLDLVATKYALKVNGGVDALAVTHIDENCSKLCDSYHLPPTRGFVTELRTPFGLDEQSKLTDTLFKCKPHVVVSDNLVQEASERLCLPVIVESFGERSCDKKFTDISK